MQYRVKEVVENGKSYFYPQYKKRWFWRRFVWWGGEDGHTAYRVFHTSVDKALMAIEEDKQKRAIKPEPRKIIYHIV